MMEDLKRTAASRPWCVERGHAPNDNHTAGGFCAMAWELGITREDNPEEYWELKRLYKGRP